MTTEPSGWHRPSGPFAVHVSVSQEQTCEFGAFAWTSETLRRLLTNLTGLEFTVDVECSREDLGCPETHEHWPPLRWSYSPPSSSASASAKRFARVSARLAEYNE